MSFLPSDSQVSITLQPGQVEFRHTVGFGLQVVRVNCNLGREPRIKAWTEQLCSTGEIEQSPMYLALSEIQQFVHVSVEQLGL